MHVVPLVACAVNMAMTNALMTPYITKPIFEIISLYWVVNFVTSKITDVSIYDMINWKDHLSLFMVLLIFISFDWLYLMVCILDAAIKPELG